MALKLTVKYLLCSCSIQKSEKLFTKHANKINDIWKEKALGFINEAIQSVWGTIHYQFIQCKVYKVTEHKRLCENYFSSLRIWQNASMDSDWIMLIRHQFTLLNI